MAALCAQNPASNVTMQKFMHSNDTYYAIRTFLSMYSTDQDKYTTLYSSLNSGVNSLRTLHLSKNKVKLPIFFKSTLIF